MPSDHFIPDTASFAEAIATACAAATNGSWVTLGISPAGPSTQYGYIVPKDDADASGCSSIAEFTEKPQEAVASTAASAQCPVERRHLYRQSLCSTEQLPRTSARHPRGVRGSLVRCVSRWRFFRLEETAFAKAPALPVDIAIMEKVNAAKVVPFRGGWDDLGSWSAVAGLSDPDTNGNRASGDVRLFGSNNSYVRSPRPVDRRVGRGECGHH
jgi:mannose-1-phosphate guanylyltransferase